jgi:hypothetical protein
MEQALDSRDFNDDTPYVKDLIFGNSAARNIDRILTSAVELAP